MSKKQNIGKKGKAEIALSREEADELQMILDRLAVQNPEGESLDRYLNSLGNALASRPHLATVLVDTLSKNPNQTGYRVFAALEKIIEPTPFKRHLKQAAYRFTQRGFTAPTEAEPRKVVLIQGESRKSAAHLFHVPGTLWLVSALVPDSGRTGHTLVTAFLEDDLDTFNVRLTESSQKLYKDYLQKLTSHAGGSKAVEISIQHAARLYFEMVDLWTAKKSLPELERARELLKPLYSTDIKPYAYELMPEIDDPARRLQEIDVAALLQGMDLSWLTFSKQDAAPFHEKMRALDSPLLVIPREVQVQRSMDEFHNAANTLCTGKTRWLYQRYFEEYAMAFKLAAAEEEATWAWIVARHLASDAPAADNPVVFQLVIHSLRLHWPDEFKEAEAQAQQAQPSPERRTESGIILP